MLPTYASFRSRPPNTGFDVVPIVGTAADINRNFYISFANRAGRSLLSEAKSIFSTGVQITLHDGLILDTEEVFWVVVSAETTGDPQEAAILAMWQARNSDQITRRSLPVEIYFSTEEHFRNNRAVTNVSGLPVAGILDGAIALDTSTGIYYRYDSESYLDGLENKVISYGAIISGHSYWVEHKTNFNAALVSTNEQFGCDRIISSVPNALKIPPKIGAATSKQERYWLNNGLLSANDGGSPIVTGKYTFDIAVDGVPGYESIFSNKIRYYLRGYINRETLELDTAIATVGQPKLWNPTNGLIVLPAELPRNHAAVYDLELVFDNYDLVGLIPQNSAISLDIVEVLNIQGAVSEIAKVIGDLIFSDLDKFLIVPGLKRLSGIASIAAGYIIEDKNEQFVTGLTEDTANQRISLLGNLNGLAKVKGGASEAFQYAEVLRATVSTETGISELTINSNGILYSLQDNNIILSVTHPLTTEGAGIVRANYPDSLIAGNNKTRFTPQNAYVYLSIGGVFYRSNLIQITAIAIQIVTLDITDCTVIPSLPIQTDPSFCLFAPQDVSLTSGGAGGFTGNARAYFAYAYVSPNNHATKINNEPTNSIPTARYNLAAAINRSLVRDQNLGDLPDKAIARNNLDVHVKAELNTHRDNTSNPHSVTATQIGAATILDLATQTEAIAANTTVINSLGTAATKNVGLAPGNVVALQDVSGVTKLPALDGSQLTNLNGQLTIEFVNSTFTAIVSTAKTYNYIVDTQTVIATANLLTTPPDKGVVIFSDRRGTFATKNLTINPGVGHTINGQANLVLTANNQSVTLVFDSSNFNYCLL